jgi:DNA-binding MarR family transcriptional regulator
MTTSARVEGINAMKRSSAALRRPAPVAGAREIDFDELPTYVGYQVRRTQAKIFADFEATLADADFTPGSFGVLTLIRANPGITQVALAAAFGVDKSTMSPVIFRLEKRGLIRREVMASDRRCHALCFEASAEPHFLAAREKVRAFEAGVASRLTRPEQRELGRLLAKLQASEGQG